MRRLLNQSCERHRAENAYRSRWGISWGRPRDVHDVLVMRALIQVLSAGDAARAVANATAAVRPGGTIYILGGGILDDDRLGPDPAVFWNITFMNPYPSGASYTEAEHTGWLSAAGCGEINRIVTQIGGGIIRATKLH
jgi:hypothetical protein